MSKLNLGKQNHALHILQVCLSFLALLSSQNANSQNLKISYINTNDYPVIEAGFIATNNDGVKIYNSSVADFKIMEGPNEDKILDVINPQQNYEAVSVVLVIDVSTSMLGERMDIVKDGLVEFIDQIPLETSEVAISCFSDDAYIYTDFTQNRNRLVSTLNRLQAINGTNFNKAFLDDMQGAMAILKAGTHKKAIVFITDGLGTTDVEKVAAMAKQSGTTVFTLGINLAVPSDLKKITEQTGGKYFEKIKARKQFNAASSAIFKQLNCTELGYVRWMSPLDCNSTREVEMKYKTSKIEFDFDVPLDRIGKIEALPSMVQFGAGKPGLLQSQPVSIVAHNIPLSINSIKLNDTVAFSAKDTTRFPFTLQPKEPHRLDVRFRAPDAGIYPGEVTITTAECPDLKVNLYGGGREQIKLLFPTGGETFSVGEDTSIRWDGIKKTQPVSIFYRLKKEEEWKALSKAQGLQYLWNLPHDTTTTAQVRLTTIKSADENMLVSAVIDEAKTPVKCAYFSSDGNKIVTTSELGIIKTWAVDSGKIISSLGGYEVSKAILTPDNQRLIMFSKDEIFGWDLGTDRLISRVNKIKKKVSLSMITPDGQENLIPGNVSIDQAKNAKVWAGFGSYKLFLLKQPNINCASFTSDGTYAVTLDNKNIIKIFKTDSALCLHSIPFKEDITSAVISPDGSKVAVMLSESLCMLDLVSGKELYRVPALNYQSFTPAGTFFIVQTGKGNNLSLIESISGKVALELPEHKFYQISRLSQFVIYNQQNALMLFDLVNRKTIFKLADKPVKLATFNSDDSKVYVLNMNNTIEIYSTGNGELLGTMDGFSRRIKGLVSNPVMQQLVALFDNNRIEIWSPGDTPQPQEVVSDNFAITSPRPIVKDTIRFPDQEIGISTDININDFIQNPTPFPISIRKMEIAGNEASDFEVATKEFPKKISAKSSDEEEFRFKPAEIGLRKAFITTYTATDSFRTLILGNGIIKIVRPVAHYINFGKVKVGSRKDTLAPILINQSEDTIVIKSITNIGPDYKQFNVPVSADKITLAPKDTLKAMMNFSPVTRGKTTSALLITLATEQLKVLMLGEGTSLREIWITGYARNSADSSLVEATVKKIDLGSGKTTEEMNTGVAARYKFMLMADRNYGIIAEKPNFISASLNIDLSEKVPEDTIRQDIFLTEIKPGSMIRLNCIFFESNKAEIMPGSQTDLKRVVDIVKTHGNLYFEIHGHTDSIGSEPYNLNLSRLRATAVMNYLVKNGASKAKLSIKGFGEKQPVSSNATEEGRMLNRRVELKIVR